MLLYELAMELGKKSSEMAEEAGRLTGTDLAPTSELTPEQVTTLRGHYAPHLVPTGSGWLPPGEAVPPPPPEPGRSRLASPGAARARTAAVVVVVLGLVGGGFAFLYGKAGEQQDRNAQELAAGRQIGGETEVAPGLTDVTGFCTSYPTVIRWTRSATPHPEEPGDVLDPAELGTLRDWAQETGYGVGTAMEDLVASTSGDLRADAERQVAATSSLRQLLLKSSYGRDLAEGVERLELVGATAEAQAAAERLGRAHSRHC